MNEILIDGYRFFEMHKDPNIYISVSGRKNFCELSQQDRTSFLNNHFGIESYRDFKQEHGNNIYGLDENMNMGPPGTEEQKKKGGFMVVHEGPMGPHGRSVRCT